MFSTDRKKSGKRVCAFSFRPCELRGSPHSIFICFIFAPKATCKAKEDEMGACHNRKGVIADYRDFDKDSQDRNNSNHD